MDIAEQASLHLDEYYQKYGLKSAYRSTIADIRKPDTVDLRNSDRAQKVIDSFEACAKHADIISIESMGGKEIFDYSIIRNDITGLLFSQAVLGGCDMEWLWMRAEGIENQGAAFYFTL